MGGGGGEQTTPFRRHRDPYNNRVKNNLNKLISLTVSRYTINSSPENGPLYNLVTSAESTEHVQISSVHIGTMLYSCYSQHQTPARGGGGGRRGENEVFRILQQVFFPDLCVAVHLTQVV